MCEATDCALLKTTPAKDQTNQHHIEMCVQTVLTDFKKNFVWGLYTYQSIPAGPTHPRVSTRSSRWRRAIERVRSCAGAWWYLRVVCVYVYKGGTRGILVPDNPQFPPSFHPAFQTFNTPQHIVAVRERRKDRDNSSLTIDLCAHIYILIIKRQAKRLSDHSERNR